MTATTSLEAMATQHVGRGDDAGRLARAVLEYLAARPASDLEQRMRREATYMRKDHPGWEALLLEAADDQAKRDYQMRTAAARIAELEGRLEKEQERSTFAGERISDLEREENALRGAYEARGEQIAELESELADRNDDVRVLKEEQAEVDAERDGALRRAEAAEGEVGRLREEAASWRRVAEAAESRVTWLEQRIATKDSLIESLKAEQLAKVEELETLEAELLELQATNLQALATTAQPSEEKPGRVIGQLAISSHGNPDYDEEPEPWGRP
jgi:chromosome segregation ATPase